MDKGQSGREGKQKDKMIPFVGAIFFGMYSSMECKAILMRKADILCSKESIQILLQKAGQKALDSDESEGRVEPLSAEALHSFKVAVLVNLASTYFSAGDMAQVTICCEPPMKACKALIDTALYLHGF